MKTNTKIAIGAAVGIAGLAGVVYYFSKPASTTGTGTANANATATLPAATGATTSTTTTTATGQ
jgi:hypothetical protein